MKTSTEVSSEKLRGGFYSPEALVDMCLDRALELACGRDQLRVLEPSAGDGAFLRGLARHILAGSIASVDAVEVMPREAAKAARCLEAVDLPGRVVTGSALDPSKLDRVYDVAVGNPPFVRFQFVSEIDRTYIQRLSRKIGVSLNSVSNLWIPVLLVALNQLRDGGVFSFIIPAECMTGLSARAVRDWLSLNTTNLRVDLCPPKSFPGVLQEVIILSGQMDRGAAHGPKVLVYDHARQDSWRHALSTESPTWTGLLLRPEYLDAVDSALGLNGVLRFGEVAKLSVATVTGANDFFCINDATRALFELEAWTRPLLDRVRNARGLIFDTKDLEANLDQGLPVWMLDDHGLPDPTSGALEYISNGESRGLHKRYKTRIRNPWWRVPVVPPGTLMLSKRSHHYPRLIQNGAQVVTTDTIYQGSPLRGFERRERDIVGSFHNSLTLLTAEMYGRSFGGGVLELVPSEVSSLALPLAPITDAIHSHLDQVGRQSGFDNDDLVNATDAHVTEILGADRDMWRLLSEARSSLRSRRLARSAKARPADRGATLI